MRIRLSAAPLELLCGAIMTKLEQVARAICPGIDPPTPYSLNMARAAAEAKQEAGERGDGQMSARLSRSEKLGGDQVSIYSHMIDKAILSEKPEQRDEKWRFRESMRLLLTWIVISAAITKLCGFWCEIKCPTN